MIYVFPVLHPSCNAFRGLPGEAPPFGDFLRLVNLGFSFLLVAPPFGDFHGRGIDDGGRRTPMSVEDKPGSAVPTLQTAVREDMFAAW